MLVDDRQLSAVTVRKFFLIPNSEYIKSTVASNEYISVGDLKEGFNQVDNVEETRKKMLVLSASGCWLPRELTFGPTNGPEGSMGVRDVPGVPPPSLQRRTLNADNA